MRGWNFILPFLLISAFAFGASAHSSEGQRNQLNDFSTDGCSMSPDGMFFGKQFIPCCVEHDVAYWRGGTREEKLDADRVLRQCIREKSNIMMAEIYYRGVRWGGLEGLPTSFHWGYGWSRRRNYKALSKSEQRMVHEKLSQVEWADVWEALGYTPQ